MRQQRWGSFAAGGHRKATRVLGTGFSCGGLRFSRVITCAGRGSAEQREHGINCAVRREHGRDCVPAKNSACLHEQQMVTANPVVVDSNAGVAPRRIGTTTLDRVVAEKKAETAAPEQKEAAMREVPAVATKTPSDVVVAMDTTSGHWQVR